MAIVNLKNEYQITNFTNLGFPGFYVRGENFCSEDLYELAGQHGFMTTVDFKVRAPSYTEFGESLTGVILYTPDETKEFAPSDMLKLRCFIHDGIQPEILKRLKNIGVPISDIQSICFLPFTRKQEFHQTGEKKVPNIVRIPLEDNEARVIDLKKLEQSFLVMKNNKGVCLADFEKEKLIGITLAFNDRCIDSRILSHFGFAKETVMANINVRQNYYDTKMHLGTLSDDDMREYKDIKEIIRIERITKLFNEIIKSGARPYELGSFKTIFQEVAEAVIAFKPRILLHGKMQVYWDVDSYIHFTMRHYKKYQLGRYKGKTPLSYKIEELEILIEQVLKIIKEEYHSQIILAPKKDFTRKGKMAIEFNGNHYALQIAPDGRLERFHAW